MLTTHTLIKPLKRFSAVVLTLALFFSLISGIFYPAFLIKQVRAATALTNVTNTPTSTKISVSTSHKIDFTTYTTVPVDGKILITFPAGFDVSSAAFSAWSGFDGNKTVAVDGQVATITRSGDGTASTAGGKYVTLSGITNHSSTSTAYQVSAQTQDASAVVLDGPTTSFYFSICTNACHTSTYQIPWDSRISTTTTHTTKFTTASTTPANGKIKLTFPDGFDISSASTTELDGAGASYDLTQSISGQTITITNASTSAIAAGANYVVIENIINYSAASSTYYVILETTYASDTNIEGPTSIRFSIVGTGLGVSSSAAWPVPLQNNRRTNKTTNSIPDYPTIEWKNTTVTALVDDGLIGNNNEIFAYKTVGNKQDLYALNTDGTTRWVYEMPDREANTTLLSGAIDAEGTIYLSDMINLGATDAQGVDALYAIDSSGQLKWVSRHNVGDAGWAGFLDLNNDGSIFIKGMPYTSAGTIYSADGLKKSGISANLWWCWASRTAIDSNNVIYATQNSTNLYAINPDGTTKWTYTSGAGGFYSAPSIDSDGTLYIATAGASAHLRAISSSNGTTTWDVVIPGGVHSLNVGAGSGVSIGQNRIVTRSDQNDITYVFDKTDGTLLATITESGTGGNRRGSATLDDNDNLLYFTDNKELTARDISGTLKWRVHGTETGTNAHAPIIGANQRIYVSDADNGGVIALKPWTLSATVNPSGVYTVGETVTFRATTSMLQTDPVSGEANQVQVYFDDGTKLALAYSSTNDDGNTVWTGTWTVPERTAAAAVGTHTATIEAAAVNVETDTTTHLDSPPTNSNNTGITTTANYRIMSRAIALPPAAFMPPSSPAPTPANLQGEFKVVINDGAATTTQREVSLTLFGSNDTKNVSISEAPDFTDAIQQSYQSTTTWTLSEGSGEKTLYVKFYNQWGRASEVVSDSIILNVPEEPEAEPAAPAEEPTAPEAPAPEAAPPTTPLSTAAQQALIQQVKSQIIVIQQKIVELITQLIQLIQEQITELQDEIP